VTADNQVASFIIVTYNSAEVVGRCLEPLAALVDGGHEVIIVDNNSLDTTLNICRTVVPGARIIQNANNEGFARAVNIGVRASIGSTVILLNPDAVGTASTFEQLIKSSSESPGAVLAPMIVHPEQRLKVVSAGRMPHLRRMFLHYSGLSRLAGPNFLEGHYLFPHQAGSDRDVEWATGACLVIPKTIWETVDGMTERWFMYAEDIEFCFRVTAAGYRIRLVPGIQVSHNTGTGTSEPKSMKPDWIVNLWQFYRDDLSPNRASNTVWKLVVAVGLASRAGYYSLKAARSTEHQVWRHESRRFIAFCAAVLKAK